MRALALVSVVVLCMPIVAVLAMCDGGLNTSEKGLNPACPPSAPYCVGNTCIQCNPYFAGDFECDCPVGQGCCRDNDHTQCTFATCAVLNKYGSACAVSNPDCTTSYQAYPAFTVQLECVSGFCRYCDPADYSSPANDTLCPSSVSQVGQTRNCVTPGLFAAPGR